MKFIIGDASDDADNFYLIGTISTTLYSIFIVIAFWRLFLSLRIAKKIGTKKLVIHVTLLLFGVCDLLYGISFMAEKR